MTPDKMIDNLLTVPYVPGGGGMAGADCWGIVELWFKHVLNIDLDDRAKNAPGHGGLQAGFDAAKNWLAIKDPEDHCLVVMRAKGFEAGHIGISYNGSVLHSDESHGCVYEPATNRFIRSTITGFLKHK